MASSSLVLESTMQEAVPETTTQETPAYEIRGRTMSLEEWELNVQTENPVDFVSLAHHGCELRRYYEVHEGNRMRFQNKAADKNSIFFPWIITN